MKFLLSLFFLITYSCLAQDEMKGSVKVKKTATVTNNIDTSKAIESFNDIIFITEAESLPSSYGQTYRIPPEFIGGESAERQFINATKKIPDCYRCKGSTVVSILTVMINEDGSLSDITLKKGAADCVKCDEEAIRIVKLMPKWKPAQLNAGSIPVKWDIYIPFTYSK